MVIEFELNNRRTMNRITKIDVNSKHLRFSFDVVKRDENKIGSIIETRPNLVFDSAVITMNELSEKYKNTGYILVVDINQHNPYKEIEGIEYELQQCQDVIVVVEEEVCEGHSVPHIPFHPINNPINNTPTVYTAYATTI